MADETLHEYTHMIGAEAHEYRVADVGDGIAIQVKTSSGGWVTVDCGSGPPEIVRLAKRIEELEKGIALEQDHIQMILDNTQWNHIGDEEISPRLTNIRDCLERLRKGESQNGE